MSNYFFSESKNSFFPALLQPVYEANGTWPADVVEVGDDQFSEFSQNPKNGKYRKFHSDTATFTWEDLANATPIPGPTTP